MKFTYKQRVKKHISLLKNNLCLGIDLHFKNLPPFLNKIKKEKGIYGSATKKDIKELKEEGIETELIPWVEDKNN